MNDLMVRKESLPAIQVKQEPVSPALIMYESAGDNSLPVLSPVYSFLNDSGWIPVPELQEFLRFYKQQEYLSAANVLVNAPHPFHGYGDKNPQNGTGVHPLHPLRVNLQEYGIQLVKLNRSSWEFGLESYFNKPLSELRDLASCFANSDLENFQELARGVYRSFFPEFPADDVSEAARKKTTYFHEWCGTFEQIAGNASKAFIRRHNIEEKHLHIQQKSSEIHPAIIARSLESDRPIDERILDIELFVRNKRYGEGSDMFVIIQYAEPKGIRCIPLQSSGRHQDFMYSNCDRDSPCSACTPRALSAILQGSYRGVIQTADVRRLDPVYRKAHDRREWWRSSNNDTLGANIVGEVIAVVCGLAALGEGYTSGGFSGLIHYLPSMIPSILLGMPLAARVAAHSDLYFLNDSNPIPLPEEAKQLYGAVLMLEDMTKKVSPG